MTFVMTSDLDTSKKDSGYMAKAQAMGYLAILRGSKRIMARVEHVS